MSFFYEIEFETYDLNLTPYSKKESTHIYSDELFTSQIISNLKGKQMHEFNKYENVDRWKFKSD